MAFPKRTFKKRTYKRRPATRKALVKTIKTVIKRQSELKTHEAISSSTQVLSGVLSNTASYRYDFAADIPLFSNSASTQRGRIGTEIDIRKLEWTGRFRMANHLTPKMNLRFILVRFNSSNGTQPTLTKIITDNNANQAYIQGIASDCPYTILSDKRVSLSNTGGDVAHLWNDFVVKLKWVSPKSTKRLVKYSDTTIALDHTSIMSGLLRLYWINDQDLTDPAYTQLHASWARVSFLDN